MGNKYSEEFFGAMDLLIQKRLEELNKDTTILCHIEDDTDATDGKYIVSNSGTRFIAYTEKTDFVAGQNVWVLVPDGNYENTKLIIGKYMGGIDDESFTYTDPFKTFVDLTGNICDEWEQINPDEELGLIANDPDRTKIAILNGNNLIPENADFTGYNRIGISADFKTNFQREACPFKGDFGLKINLITDKSNGDVKTIWLNTDKMQGASPFTPNSSYRPQKLVYEFDPEEVGNVISITCEFYESPNSFSYLVGGQIESYPYKNIEPNLFVKNIQIRVGLSTNDIKSTAVFLRKPTAVSPYYNSLLSIDDPINRKEMDFRFVYKNGDGTYTAYNNYDSFNDFRVANGGKPLLYLYKQINDFNYYDNRGGYGWQQEDWKEDDLFRNNFKIFKTLGDKKGSTRFKIGAVFNMETLWANEIERFFFALTDENSNKLYPNMEDFSDDEKKAIELFFNADFTDEEIFGELNDTKTAPKYEDRHYTIIVKDENDNIIETKTALSLMSFLINITDNDYKYLEIKDTDSDNLYNKPGKTDVLKNYIILFKQHELDNKTIEINSVEYENLLDLLIKTTIADHYSSVGSTPLENFNLVKSNFENIIFSDPLVFSDIVDAAEEVTGLIQGLSLTATDDKNGVYNIYKASENANNELIKPVDGHTKRNIEVSFNSIITQNESLDDAERIYWFIPKINTMIKEPVQGTTYGEKIFNMVLYTHSEFNEWKESKDWDSTASDLYRSTSEESIITNDIVWENLEKDSNGRAKLYIKTTECLLVDTEDAVENEYQKKYTEAIPEGDDYESERNFVKRLINSFWVIYENHVGEQGALTAKFKKASVTYQIKSTYRQSLNNNKIYVAVYRNKKLYTQSIDLMFGVKGMNGTDYTLSITPSSEIVQTNDNQNLINVAPNAWTFGNTQFFGLKATIYDANDKILNNISGVIFSWSIIKGENVFTIPEDSEINNTELKIINDSQYVIKMINEANFNNANAYKGAIIKCTAKSDSLGFNISQHFVLPVRTSSEFSYIDGPDTIVYDVSNANPDWYNVPYDLKKENDTSFSDVVAERKDLISGEDIKYFPDIKVTEAPEEKYYLIPKATYIEGTKLDFYIDISCSSGHWYQPILITVNNYANTTVNSIRSGLITGKDNESTATILSALKKDDAGKLTGILMGNLPIAENQDSYYKGVLGYVQDEPSYAFLSDGSGFIGSDIAQAKFTGDEWGLFAKAINDYEAQLMKLSANEKYLKSLNYITSNGAQGLSINLDNGEITGLNLTIADIYWGNNNNKVAPNTILAGPASGNTSNVPTFRALTGNDFANVSLTELTINGVKYTLSVEQQVLGNNFNLVLTRQN